MKRRRLPMLIAMVIAAIGMLVTGITFIVVLTKPDSLSANISPPDRYLTVEIVHGYNMMNDPACPAVHVCPVVGCSAYCPEVGCSAYCQGPPCYGEVFDVPHTCGYTGAHNCGYTGLHDCGYNPGHTCPQVPNLLSNHTGCTLTVTQWTTGFGTGGSSVLAAGANYSAVNAILNNSPLLITGIKFIDFNMVAAACRGTFQLYDGDFMLTGDITATGTQDLFSVETTGTVAFEACNFSAAGKVVNNKKSGTIEVNATAVLSSSGSNVIHNSGTRYVDAFDHDIGFIQINDGTLTGGGAAATILLDGGVLDQEVLEVNDGTVTNIYATANNSAQAIRNNASGTVRINDGEILRPNQTGQGTIRNANGKIYVDGGEIHGMTSGTGVSIYQAASATSRIVISDGLLSSQYPLYAVANMGSKYREFITITGGTLQGTTALYLTGATGQVSITGASTVIKATNATTSVISGSTSNLKLILGNVQITGVIVINTLNGSNYTEIELAPEWNHTIASALVFNIYRNGSNQNIILPHTPPYALLSGTNTQITDVIANNKISLVSAQQPIFTFRRVGDTICIHNAIGVAGQYDRIFTVTQSGSNFNLDDTSVLGSPVNILSNDTFANLEAELNNQLPGEVTHVTFGTGMAIDFGANGLLLTSGGFCFTGNVSADDHAIGIYGATAVTFLDMTLYSKEGSAILNAYTALIQILGESEITSSPEGDIPTIWLDGGLTNNVMFNIADTSRITNLGAGNAISNFSAGNVFLRDTAMAMAMEGSALYNDGQGRFIIQDSAVIGSMGTDVPTVYADAGNITLESGYSVADWVEGWLDPTDWPLSFVNLGLSGLMTSPSRPAFIMHFGEGDAISTSGSATVTISGGLVLSADGHAIFNNSSANNGVTISGTQADTQIIACGNSSTIWAEGLVTSGTVVFQINGGLITSGLDTAIVNNNRGRINIQNALVKTESTSVPTIVLVHQVTTASSDIVLAISGTTIVESQTQTAIYNDGLGQIAISSGTVRSYAANTSSAPPTIYLGRGTVGQTILNMTAGTITGGGQAAILNAGAGTVNIASGTITGRHIVKTVASGKVNIAGGTHTATAAALYGYGSGITISNGSITGNGGITNFSTETGNIEINGGTLRSNSSAPAIQMENDITLEISDGIINNTGTGFIILNNSGGEITITGGTLMASNYAIWLSAGIGTAGVTILEISGEAQVVSYADTAIRHDGAGKVVISGGITGSLLTAIELTYEHNVHGVTVLEISDGMVMGVEVAIDNWGDGDVNISGGLVMGMEEGIAIHNQGTGAITISGGIIMAGEGGGSAIYNEGTGKVTISEASSAIPTLIIAGGSEATIYLDNNSALEITGGIVENTDTGSAILLDNADASLVLGNAAITGAIERSSAGLGAAIELHASYNPATAPNYTFKLPSGTYLKSDPYTLLSGISTQVGTGSKFILDDFGKAIDIGDVNVYNAFEVFFNKNNTDLGAPNPSITSKTVELGETYGTLATISRTGWLFDGWYTHTTAGIKIESATVVLDSHTGANDSLTLYARWVQVFVTAADGLADGKVDVAYNQTIEVVQAGAALSITSGSLPTGLGLSSSTGAITGTPEAVGSYTFTVQVTVTGGSVTREFTIVIAKGDGSGTVTMSGWTYGGAPSTPSITNPNSVSTTTTYTGRNGTSYGPTTTRPTNAGDYTVTVIFAENTNYLQHTNSANFTIAKATLDVRADHASRVYGTSNPSFDWIVVSGLVSPDTESSVKFALTGNFSFSTTATSSSNAGTYAITMTLNTAAHSNYSFNILNGSPTPGGVLTITKATLDVRADHASRVYGVANPGFDWIVVSGLVSPDTGSSVKSALSGNFTFSTTATTTSNVGTYAITMSLNTASHTNYSFNILNGSPTPGGVLTITKATLDVRADHASRVYGTSNPSFDWTVVSGLVSPDTESSVKSSLSGNFTFSTTATSSSNAGTYAITMTLNTASHTNYSFNILNGSPTPGGVLTITKATLDVRADHDTKVYGTSNPSFDWIVVSGLVSPDTESSVKSALSGNFSFSTTATTTSSVGTYAITMTLNTASHTNYSFNILNGSPTPGGVLTITKATLDVRAAHETRVYGTSNPSFDWTVISGLVSPDTESSVKSALSGNFSFSTTATSSSNAGTYAITMTLNTASHTNYNFNILNGIPTPGGVLTITKATVTIRAKDINITYGSWSSSLLDYDPPSGFVSPDTIAVLSGLGSILLDVTWSGATPGDAGSYTITIDVSGVTAANYNISGQTGTLNIINANDVLPPTISGNPTNTFVYKGSAYNILTEWSGFTDMAVINDATYTSVTSATNAGTYKIYIEITNPSKDWAPIVTLIPDTEIYEFTWIISKATLDVRAAHETRVYGTSNPSFNWIVVSGLLGSDNESSVKSALSGNFTFSTTATSSSNAGTYAITMTLNTASHTNYSFNILNGSPSPGGVLTITKATLDIRASHESRVYGTSNPSFDWIVISGLVSPDTESSVKSSLSGNFTFSTTATTTSNAGTYAITMTLNTASHNNYSFNILNGSPTPGGVLTITKAALDVRADHDTKVYGTSNPSFDWTVISGLVSPDTESSVKSALTGNFSFSTTATSSSNTGTYAITMTLNTASHTNYNFNILNGSPTPGGVLTITKATLDVRADHDTKVYGTSNPSFDWIVVSGLVSPDTESSVKSSLSGNFTFSTTATSSSNAGTYAITMTLNTASHTNYSFNILNGSPTPGGVLTITKAILDVRADHASRIYGAVNPSFDWVVVSALVSPDTESSVKSSLSGNFTFSTTATPSSNVGTYAITMSLNTASHTNYSFNILNGSPTPGGVLTVTKASVTRPTWDSDWFNFNGAEQGPDLTYDDTRINILAGSTLKETATGNYYIAFELKDKTNYQWEDETDENIILDWVIESNVSFTKPTINKSFVYTSDTITITESDITGFNSSTMMIVVGNSNMSATTVGSSYKITIALLDKVNTTWNDGTTNDIVLYWSITKAALSWPAFSGASSFTYDGNSKAPVIINWNSITVDRTGSLNATNVGSYNIVFSIIDTVNYEWVGGGTADRTLTWYIVSTSGTVTPPTVVEAHVYGANLSEWTLSNNWSWVNGSERPTVVNNGYLAQIHVSNLDDNYDYTGHPGYHAASNSVRVMVSITVTPAPLTIKVEGFEREYDKTTNVEHNYTITGFKDNPAALTALRAALVISYSPAFIGNAGTYTMTPSGYANSNYLITFVSDILTITKSSKWNESPELIGKARPGMRLSQLKLSDGWNWVEGDIVIEEGEYRVKVYFDVSDLVDNYDFQGIAGYDPSTMAVIRDVMFDVVYVMVENKINKYLLYGLGVGFLLFLILLVLMCYFIYVYDSSKTKKIMRGQPKGHVVPDKLKEKIVEVAEAEAEQPLST